MDIKKLTRIGSNIPQGTSGSVLFEDSNGKLAQDNSNFLWDDANNRLETQNSLVKGTFQNYNPDLIDMGAEQVNDVRGYGDDYVAEKTLSRCRVAGSADSEEGQFRVNNGVFQIGCSSRSPASDRTRDRRRSPARGS